MGSGRAAQAPPNPPGDRRWRASAAAFSPGRLLEREADTDAALALPWRGTRSARSTSPADRRSPSLGSDLRAGRRSPALEDTDMMPMVNAFLAVLHPPVNLLVTMLATRWLLMTLLVEFMLLVPPTLAKRTMVGKISLRLW